MQPSGFFSYMILNQCEISASCFTRDPVPEFIDPVFTKTSPKRSFSVIENKHYGIVFEKTGSIISGTGAAKASLV